MTKSSESPKDHRDAPATTRREETPALEGREPLPEELTGRASGTDEDLATLFENESANHLRDGFRGGSDDDSETDVIKVDDASIEEAGDSTPDVEEHDPTR
ncbi:MAG: hypothetical protein V4558_14805 [Gemmatimonadota bacterium]